MCDNIQNAFLQLLKIGLWGNVNPEIRIDENTDWQEVYRLATEQSVLGLVLAGLEHSDVKSPQMLLLQWIGEVQMIEQRNKDMNGFVAELIEKLRRHDTYALLVKGQGLAQCYEKPLWRTCGDIDLFLSEDNYQKAKAFLQPLSSSVEEEYVREKHLGMTIDGWAVELHGYLYSGLSSRVEKELDALQQDTFYRGEVRSWMNGKTQVFLLKAENDIFYVFTHILQHFYKEGVGLRQVCDWCRLLYTYKDSMNYGLLESRIKRAGLMSEWKAFYNLASRYLGMPDFGSQDSQARMSDHRSSAGLTVHDSRFDKKADRIMKFILKSGNMGHNRDMSHFSKYPYLVRKCVSMGRRFGDLINHARIFPLDSLKFFPRIMFNGVRSVMRGE
jgi:hypothetical protein